MRSMSLVAIRRAVALAIAGGALIAAAAQAQPSGTYADQYRAYDQQYGGYGSPPQGAYDQDDDASAYTAPPPYRGQPPQSEAYGNAGAYGYSPYGSGYGQPYADGGGSPQYGYNPDSYGQPGYAPPANASPDYHRDAGGPGYYAPGGDEGGDGPPPAAYGRYGDQGYGGPNSGQSGSSDYPLPPN